ncbi:MAG TPA: DUF58 domain-containing protein [Candidatus Hydrogenedentes bacterium]|nr:DUF58 domain-containing protein [Candidatus Hydrogenedentota bacterium]
MKRRRTDSLERFTRFLWLYKLTPAGRILVATGIITGTLAAPSLEIPAFQTFLTLFCVGFIAFLVNLFARPRVEVTGHFPDKATAKHPVTGAFVVRNKGLLPALRLGAGYFGLHRALKQQQIERELPSLGRHEAATLPITLEPLRRGLYPLPKLRVFSTFPFNICRTGKAHNSKSSLLVLPDFHPIAGVDVPIGTRYQPGGIALTSDVGESPEYIGNREYREGDPIRHIDFRAWARIAQPVVREYQEEYYCRVVLVLDTYIPRNRWLRPRGGFRDLEAAVSLAASVADALSRGEYIIDIFAAGPELYVFRAGRHTAHLENVLEILACVDECRTNPFDKVAPALTDELGSISTVVCVLLDWDASREALMRAAVEAGCSTKVILVRDKPPAMDYGPAEDWLGPILSLSPSEVFAGGIEQL